MGQRLTFSYTADVASSANPELVVLQATCRALTRLRDEAAARSLAELVVRRYANLTRARDDVFVEIDALTAAFYRSL